MDETCPTCGKDGYRNPALAVDAAALRMTDSGLELLLIRRGREPWKGSLAFPGGFVDEGEDPEVAVLRELAEETGVIGHDPRLVTVRGDPERDPRKHIVSILYRVTIPDEATRVAGDDAAAAEFHLLDDVDGAELAGDHGQMLENLRDSL